MSDEIHRSAHGNRPPQGRGAPAWWTRLDRVDLPEEGVESAADPQSPPASGNEPDTGNRSRARSRRRGWLLYIVVAAAAMVVTLIGVGASSTHSAIAALLVIAAPLGLAALAGAAVVRHTDW